VSGKSTSLFCVPFVYQAGLFSMGFDWTASSGLVFVPVTCRFVEIILPSTPTSFRQSPLRAITRPACGPHRRTTRIEA